MTSGSNCRHLNKPQTEEARRSIRPAYHRATCKVATLPPPPPTRSKSIQETSHLMKPHLIVSREEWLSAPKALLVEGKKTRASDELARCRLQVNRRPNEGPKWSILYLQKSTIYLQSTVVDVINYCTIS